jgi:hypothetical protein
LRCSLTSSIRSPILHSLAKQARNLGGFKIARQALDAMQNLLIPAQFQVSFEFSLIRFLLSYFTYFIWFFVGFRRLDYGYDEG